MASRPGCLGTMFAFDGRRVAYFPDQEAFFAPRDGSAVLLLLDSFGRGLGRFLPDRCGNWQPFFAAGGKELWLFDASSTSSGTLSSERVGAKSRASGR